MIILTTLAKSVATATPLVSHLINPVNKNASPTLTAVDTKEIISGADESPIALNALAK